MKEFKTFDEFLKFFKYNTGKDLKLAYGHDYRENIDFDTGKKFIEIYMDYHYKKVKKLLWKKYNLKFSNQKQRIYIKKIKK